MSEGHNITQELLQLGRLLIGQDQQGEPLHNLVERLDFHGLTALIPHSQLDPETKKSLQLKKPLLVANESLRSNELSRLFSTFSELGLNKYVVFKGWALAYTVYEEPWQRPRTDVDILISKSDLDIFTRAFESLGYQKLFGISGNYVSYQHTFVRKLVGDASINIDLHWKISNRQCLSQALRVEELFLEGNWLPNFDVKVAIPSNIDNLLICCIHRLGHHHDDERMAWLYDIHLLSKSLSESDWRQFILKSQSKNITAICYDSLVAASKYLSTPIPNQVMQSLQEDEHANESSSILVSKKLNQWQLFLNDVAAVPGIVGKIRFTVETILPSPDYVRQRTGQSSLIKAYLIRTKQAVKKIMR